MKNKKVLWIINQYANIPSFPGHTRQYEIASGLLKKQWIIDIFASDFNLSQRKFKRLNGFMPFLKENIDNISWNWIKVIPYKQNNILRYLNLISFCFNLFFILNIKYIFGLISQSNPSFIIGSSPQLPASFLTFIFAKIYRIKFIFEVRDIWPQVLIDTNQNLPIFLIKILKSMERFLYQNSDLIIVLTMGAEKYVKKEGGTNIICLPNGPDLNKFKFKKLPKENSDFNKKRKFKLLYSGSHGKVNGLMNVIEAFKLLKDYPIEMHFLGDGPEKLKLIKASSGMKNIKFFDPISKSKMPSILAKYDAILLSLDNIKLFTYGVSPNKLYDAYAVGRPVIATVPGEVNREIIKFNLGVTAKANNPKELSDSIIKLFSKSRKDREIMGINARKCAENYYSRDLIIDKLDVSLSELT